MKDNFRGGIMLFELREYDIKPGHMPAWLRLMQEEIHPFQLKLGVIMIASFVGKENPDKYVWIRRFDNEAERQRLYKVVYEDPYWLSHIKPKIDSMLNRDTMRVTLLEATPVSPIH